MKLFFCILLFPVAVLAQSVGDTTQKVVQMLGRPQSQRTTGNLQVWLYTNGTKIKFENGVVCEVSGRPAAADPAAPAAGSGPAAAANGGGLHKSILAGCQGSLVRAGGGRADAQPLMQKRYLFVYFSAHWCPPCRKFTPHLVEFYNQHFKNGDFDLLFISSDEDQDHMDTYMRETGMPWTGIKLGNPTNETLSQRFGVTGIPCLVLLNERDEVLASSFNGATYLGPQAALEKYEALHEN